MHRDKNFIDKRLRHRTLKKVEAIMIVIIKSIISNGDGTVIQLKMHRLARFLFKLNHSV